MFTVNPSITPELLEDVWSKLKDTPSFWGELDGASFDAFVRAYVDSKAIILFDFGIARISTGWNGSVGEIHAAFWNRKVVRSVPEIKRALWLVAQKLHFFEFVITVPKSSRRLRKLLGELGFRQRGELNRFYEVRNSYHSAILYGILKGEVQDGRHD